jgi:hypothetical protein
MHLVMPLLLLLLRQLYGDCTNNATVVVALQATAIC